MLMGIPIGKVDIHMGGTFWDQYGYIVIKFAHPMIILHRKVHSLISVPTDIIISF